MTVKEYLNLFSNNGLVKVQVKFKDHDDSVATQTMNPIEINELISSSGKEFITQMTFDDWLFEIYKYEIDPIKNIITIRAKKSSSNG
ncbi:hypothetical protein OQJ46_00775 [Microbulbifer thermotolerans]|uniref:hypothetical protein n=1 Tax=Microbulbifer thermotolerans TaxID=252514 RepID=UPI00224A766B|nr:hypothetical protein [Microbulbifer thermotolerans]MCX2781521.1 hypothetical protein [Microbulbifer thermotolerans]